MRTNEGWSKGGGGGGKLPCRSGGGGWQKRKGSSGCVRYEGSISRESGKKGADREGGRSLSLSERRQAAEGELFFVANFCYSWGKRREREEEEEEEMLCLLLAIYLSRPHNNSLFFLR